MGGKILEYEAKTILNKGRQEGRLAVCLEMIAAGMLTVPKAAQVLGISEEELKEKMEEGAGGLTT